MLQLSDPLEQYIADSLTRAGIMFIHESQDSVRTSALDFYLPEYLVYLEVKGGHSNRISGQMSRAMNVIAIQGVKSVDFICKLLSTIPRHSGHV
jgi:hypothetical protein